LTIRWRPARGVVFVLGALLWVAIPVVVLVAAQRRSAKLEIDTPTTTWTEVVRSTEPVRQDLTLGVWWRDPEAVYAPAMTGAVEQVRLRAGDPLADLDRPLVVGGVERVAVNSPAPFFRPLVNGDTGRDVGWLNDLLSRLNLEASSGESFTNATQRGVQAFAQSIGAGAQPTFDPAWVLFIPSERFIAASVSLGVGQPAPPAGTPIIIGARRIDRATTNAFAGSSASSSAGPSDSGVASSASSLHLTPVSVPADAEVAVAGTKLRLDPSRQAVDPADLPTLESLVVPLAPQVAAVTLAPPVAGSWRVPVAATFEGPDGRTCVLRRRSSTMEATAVELRSVRDGAAVVSGSLAPGDHVALPAPPTQRRC